MKTSIALFSLALLLGGPVLAQPKKGGKDDKDKKDDKKPTTVEKVTIVLTNGRKHEGATLQEEKFAAIKFKPSRGPDESVKGEDVAEIRFDQPGPAFPSGLSQMNAGLYDRAIKSFTNARNTAKDGTSLRIHATFWLAEALRLEGTDETLKAAAEEYGRVPGDHYLAPRAAYGLGLALAGAGKQSEALASFKKLEGFGDRWRIQGKLGEGNALLALKKPGDARQAFEIANSGAGSRFTELAREAQTGIGKAFVLDKRYDDAVKNFDRILEARGVDVEVAGSAWVGKGDCRFAQAQEKGGQKELLQEALLAYLTAATRYAGSSAYGRALYMAAEIYGKLGLPEQQKHLAGELKSRFPNWKPAK